MKLIKKVCVLSLIVSMLVSMFVVTNVSANTLAQTIDLIVPEGEINVSGEGEELVVALKTSDRNGLKGIKVKIQWNPEYLYMDPTVNEYEDENENIVKEYAGVTDFSALLGTGSDTDRKINTNDIPNGILNMTGFRSSVFTSSKTDYLLCNLHFKVLPAAAGKKVDIDFIATADQNGSTVLATCGITSNANVAFSAMNGASFTVAGGEDDKTPAEKINLLTANGVAKSDVYVTNNNGSKYHVDSALVFVSSVDKGNTPVKTVITCDDFADTKLEIEAAHTQEINGLTYFAAAMSSIKETNYGKTFKATAYVTNADGEEVVGVPATGIFTK